MVLKLAQPEYITSEGELELLVFHAKEINQERLLLAKELEKIAKKVEHTDWFIPWFVGCKCYGCMAEKKISKLVLLLRESVKK